MRQYYQLFLLYLGAFGISQEDIRPRKIYEGFAFETRRERSYTSSRVGPPEQFGTIFTKRRNEARHNKPYTDRIARILQDDQEMDPPNRKMALTHLLEYYALVGLRKSAQSLKLPPGEHIDFSLAPSLFEQGVGIPFREPGVDILVSYMKGGGKGPREVTAGANIKSKGRRLDRIRYWLSRRMECAPCFDIHLGGWITTADGKTNLQSSVSRASASNKDAQDFIGFMEKNAEPFSRFVFHLLANATYKYEEVAQKSGHLRLCTPEGAQMFPEDPANYERTITRIHRLNEVFRSNGVPSLWRQNVLPPDYTYMDYLPVGVA